MPSPSRQPVKWVVDLRYEDLPPAVVDRAKGVTLHSLASVLLGFRSPAGQQVVKLIAEEEVGVRNGATIMAAGNLEGARSGGRALREGAAAQRDAGGGPGPAGVLGARPSSRARPASITRRQQRGPPDLQLRGRYPDQPGKITAGLGKEWMFLETLYRIYSTAGYDIAHIDVTASLGAEHDICYDDVDRVEAVVNWLETQYPSPAFPSRREDRQSNPGNTAYFTAYGVLERGFPLLNGAIDPDGHAEPPEVSTS